MSKPGGGGHSWLLSSLDASFQLLQGDVPPASSPFLQLPGTHSLVSVVNPVGVVCTAVPPFWKRGVLYHCLQRLLFTL